MRTVRHDPLRASPYSKSLERFNVFSGKLLEQQLVTHASSGLARTTFGIAKHSEVDVGRLHEFYNTAGDLLQPTVIRCGASDPIEHIAIGIVPHVWHTKAISPCHAFLRRHPPWIASAAGFLQCLGRRSAKLAVGHQGPPQIRDKSQRAYAKGTNVHARGAGRACPQSFV